MSELLPLPAPEILRRLFARDAHALEALETRGASPRVDEEPTPSGPVLRVAGRKLHSARDPAREAQRYVRGVDVTEATIIVLMGWGSGHVARALRRHSDATMVVFEPDLDVLRRGLTHGAPPEDCLICSDPDRLGATLYEIFSAGDRGKLVIWQPSIRLDPAIYGQAIEQTRLAVERAEMRAVTNQVRVEGWLDHYLENLHQLSRGPGISRLKGALRGVPAVICSAGPSLDRQLEALAGLDDRALVLAVNTAATALGRAGIRPHAVVSVESLDITAQLAQLPWIGEVAAFLELTGNPKIFSIPFQRVLPISVDTSACARFTRRLDPDNHVNGGFCVAHTAMSIAHVLGCSPIVLIGQDLAFSGDRVYASGTIFGDIRAEIRGGDSRLTNAAAKTAIEDASAGTFRAGARASRRAKVDRVPGWGGGPEVVTTRDFRLFRDWFARAGESLRARGVEAVNATEGGAEIANWTPEPFRALIERLGLDQPPVTGQEGITARFARLTAQPGVPPEALRDALIEERSQLARLLECSRQALQLVGHDPDGDITASPEVSAKLATIQAEVARRLGSAPLVAEALTVPLDALRDRQELNTFTLHRAISHQLAQLDQRLVSALARVEAEMTARDEPLSA